MLKTVEEYLGIEFPKDEVISGSWFAERGLPMIVECACCGSTMVLPSALVDDDGTIVCKSCGTA